MKQRDSFVFYRSFFEAVSELKPKEQTEVILAICEYALNGTERQLSGVQKAVFILIKPNLDANQKKYENGKKGGRPIRNQNQIGTEQKPNGNQAGGQEEREPKPIQNPMDDELCIRNYGSWVREDGEDAKHDPTLAVVLKAYHDTITPTPSQHSLDELKELWAELGTDCCLRAFEIAIEAKKATWPYIRAILRSKQRQGVRCLADWDALEDTRRKGGSGATQRGGETNQDREKSEMDWMDEFLGAKE